MARPAGATENLPRMEGSASFGGCVLGTQSNTRMRGIAHGRAIIELSQKRQQQGRVSFHWALVRRQQTKALAVTTF